MQVDVILNLEILCMLLSFLKNFWHTSIKHMLSFNLGEKTNTGLVYMQCVIDKSLDEIFFLQIFYYYTRQNCYKCMTDL